MKWSFRKRITIAISLVILVLAIGTGFAFWCVRNFQQEATLVSHSNTVISRLEEIRYLISTSESTYRSYLFYQQKANLDTFNSQIQLVNQRLTELNKLVSDNSSQLQNSKSLQSLFQQWLDFQKNLSPDQSPPPTLLTGNGTSGGPDQNVAPPPPPEDEVMSQIQATINEMVGIENKLLQSSSDNAQNGATLTNFTFLLLALLTASLVVLLAYLVRQYSKERHQAEADLMEQKEFATNILELSPIGKAVMDTNHKVLIWNKAIEKLTGFKAEDMIGTTKQYLALYQEEQPTFNDIIIDQDCTQLKKYYPDAIIEQKPYGQSIRVERWLHLNGKQRFVAFEANPIYDQQGKLRASMTTYQDLTQKKRTEDALRESENRFRLLIEKLSVGVTLQDPNSKVLLANDAAYELLGLSEDQLLGRTSYDPEWKGIHEDGTDFSGDARPVPQAILTRKPVHNVTMGVYRPKDASWVWLLVNAEPLLDEEGYVTNIICSFSDITERKKVEQLKTEFISVVSHELRTPLTSILGSLGLIMGGVAGEIPAGALGMMNIAHKNSERLVRLINDILDIEKIESGKMIFHLKEVELAPLVEQAIASTRSYAEQYGVQFDFAIKGALPARALHVLADYDRLTQVIVNLLSNAAKFSPSGETVKVELFAFDDKVVRLSVCDKGPGISKEFQSRIFQKFAQADSSDTRQKGGTGLGLSISKAIVEKLKGEISFTTEIGEGTTFNIDLPLLKAVDKEKSQPLKLETAQIPLRFIAPATHLLQPEVQFSKKILICEDDQDVALLLEQNFRQQGFSCDIAASATQTRYLLEHNSYILMTLDLLLPDEDGLRFLKELRSQEKTRSMPIIVVSAVAEQGKVEFSGLPFTVVDWINKPIDQARLISAVKVAAKCSELSSSHRPQILHIEDDPDLAQVVAVLLSGIAEVKNVRTAREALQKLKTEKFDLILLDVELPDSSTSSLPDLLNNPVLGVTPVIVFSGQEIDGDYSRKIAAGLVKSRTTNQELIATIQQTFNRLNTTFVSA